MEADSLDRAWDPAAPGAGALRATAIAQLYFRMTSYHPLTILIVDAMCLTFGPDGATVQELIDYLGITEDRIRFGLDGIPAEMRCTNLQLESEKVADNAGDEGSGYTGSTRGGSAGGRNKLDAQTGRRAEKEVRYYLNYKRLLPIVYAHLSRLLLATCVVDVPLCSYVATVKAAQLAPYSRTSDSTAHAFFAATPTATAGAGGGVAATATTGGLPSTPASPTALSPSPAPSGLTSSSARSTDGTGEHIEVSDAMRRKNAIRGVYCLGCSCYFLVEEFAETISRCPRCGKDALQLCLQSIQRQLNARVADQHTLVKLLPSVSQVWKRSVAAQLAAKREATNREVQQQQQSQKELAEMPAPSSNAGVRGSTAFLAPSVASPSASAAQKSGVGAFSAQQSLNCALAADPFLFQQALAFRFLYTSRFASVNDAASVVDAQQILTEPEYRERLRGKASLADQFRSRHHHASAVHVRLVSQREVDAARRADSHRKLLKRAMLPPWLRHTASLAALGGGHVYTAHTTAEKVTAAEAKEGEPWNSEELVVATSSDHAKGPLPHSGAVWKPAPTAATSQPASPGEKRKRPVEMDVKAELTRAADFIAEQFFEDDYDEVPLPLSRRRQL